MIFRFFRVLHRAAPLPATTCPNDVGEECCIAYFIASTQSAQAGRNSCSCLPRTSPHIFREFFLGFIFPLCFSFVKFRRLAERACCSELVSLHVIAKSLVGVNSKDRFLGVNEAQYLLLFSWHRTRTRHNRIKWANICSFFRDTAQRRVTIAKMASKISTVGRYTAENEPRHLSGIDPTISVFRVESLSTVDLCICPEFTALFRSTSSLVWSICE